MLNFQNSLKQDSFISVQTSTCSGIEDCDWGALAFITTFCMESIQFENLCVNQIKFFDECVFLLKEK